MTFMICIRKEGRSRPMRSAEFQKENSNDKFFTAVGILSDNYVTGLMI
jgi:hypothetical protein